jgi:hypothetical protein
MRRWVLAMVMLVGAGAMAWAQPAATRPAGGTALEQVFPGPRPFPGVTYEHEVRANPPLHLHIVSIDLARPGVRLVVRPGGDDPDEQGPWQTVLGTTSGIAERDGLDVAVNGDFFEGRQRLPLVGAYFEGNWARVSGMAMSDGRLWSDRTGRNALVVDAAGRVGIGPLKSAPPAARQIIGGGGMVLQKGIVVGPADAPAPRSAVGIDRAGGVLVLLVVDGRRPYHSAGLSQKQLGEELLRLGCSDGLNLDGGGSSTLVMRDPEAGQWRILNRPSDGSDRRLPLSVERPVANVLGVIVDEGDK